MGELSPSLFVFAYFPCSASLPDLGLFRAGGGGSSVASLEGGVLGALTVRFLRGFDFELVFFEGAGDVASPAELSTIGCPVSAAGLLAFLSSSFRSRSAPRCFLSSSFS